MISSGSLVLMRSMSALSFGLPGAIAAKSSRFAVANSNRSSRSLALRLAESGPWQAKQFSARMGWM